MEDRSTQSLLQEQQEKSLFLFVVVVGYIITFVLASNGGTNYTTLQVLLGISFGAIYLSLIYFEAEILGRFSPNTKSLLFFSIQLLLVLGIGWLLGPGGNWLIGLPLVGVAVEWLSPRSRWYVYVGLIAAIVLPILHYSTWITAVMNAFVISAAIFFVAALTQSRINEQEARARAEELTVELEKANYRLAEYASQVEELAAAEERNRLAREIHDSVGHYLTIVNVQLEAAKVVFHSDPERALDALEKAHELVRKGLSSVRESVLALRVSPVENRPLEDAIRSVVEEARASGIKVDLKLHGTPKAVDDKTALALYRSAQEGLTNVRKHANAASAEIELDYSQPGTRLPLCPGRWDGSGGNKRGIRPDRDSRACPSAWWKSRNSVPNRSGVLP